MTSPSAAGFHGGSSPWAGRVPFGLVAGVFVADLTEWVRGGRAFDERERPRLRVANRSEGVVDVRVAVDSRLGCSVDDQDPEGPVAQRLAADCPAPIRLSMIAVPRFADPEMMIPFKPFDGDDVGDDPGCPGIR